MYAGEHMYNSRDASEFCMHRAHALDEKGEEDTVEEGEEEEEEEHAIGG